MKLYVLIFFGIVGCSPPKSHVDETLDLPVCQFGWTHSNGTTIVRINVNGDDRYRNLGELPQETALTASLKAAKQKRAYIQFLVTAPATYPALDFLRLARLVNESVQENTRLNVECRMNVDHSPGRKANSSVFQWPVTVKQFHQPNGIEVDYVILELSAGGQFLNQEKIPSDREFKERMSILLESAHLTDSLPVCIIGVGKEVSLQDLISAFDFEGSGDYTLIFDPK